MALETPHVTCGQLARRGMPARDRQTEASRAPPVTLPWTQYSVCFEARNQGPVGSRGLLRWPLAVLPRHPPACHKPTGYVAWAQCHLGGAGALLSHLSDATKSFVWPDIGLLQNLLGVGVLTAAQQPIPEVPGAKPINRLDVRAGPIGQSYTAGVPALWGLYGLTAAKRSIICLAGHKTLVRL